MVTAPVKAVNGKTALPKIGRVGLSDTPRGARIVMNAVEGWGKTSLGAHGPKPIVLMARGETGFVTLRERGLVPDADVVECSSWSEVLGVCDSLTGSDHQTYVLDALGGFERLCHEEVCRREFGGVWGDAGFDSYKTGYDVAVTDWLKLLQRLDAIRAVNGATIIILSHTKIAGFKNPMGPDFDRYGADCHHKTWGVTHKWADAVLFGTFETVVHKETKKARAKGIGGTERVMFTERTDAYDAKNRYRMLSRIEMGDDPAQTWNLLWSNLCGKAPAVDGPPEL